jgi:hypothetical protein
MRLQHVPHAAAEAEIGMPDDAGADSRPTINAARACRGDAIDEFRFAHWAKLWSAGAVHRAALHENGRHDIVAALRVGQQIWQLVTPARSVPQMMVWIDDGHGRFNDLLPAAVQPVLTDW